MLWKLSIVDVQGYFIAFLDMAYEHWNQCSCDLKEGKVFGMLWKISFAQSCLFCVNNFCEYSGSAVLVSAATKKREWQADFY